MTPAAKMTSLAETDLSRSMAELEVEPPEDEPGESPTAILPKIHMDCSYTSLLGLESSEINVGMASACRKSKCWDDGDNCCGKEVSDPAAPMDPGTGVGGGRKELLGTAECAPPGGGARDVKLIPAACEAFEF